MGALKDRTIIITGSSRGIGRAMAIRFARDGANIVVAAKTAKPHPKLPGTIHTVAEEIEKEGGRSLAVQVDVRDEANVQAMIDQTVETFGGIDVLINNAGAISLTPVEKTELKRYDLMQSVNTRAVFLCSRTALPHLKKGTNAHILNLSPPVSFDRQWFAKFAPYTVSKFGMSMLTLGMSDEFRQYNIAVNSLWPRTTIATAAIEFAVGGREMFKVSRVPEIMADAAYEVVTTDGMKLTGQTLLDEDLLRERGVTDFKPYAFDPEHSGSFQRDLFVSG